MLEKFTARANAPYLEQDFAWIAEWGFDFVRLPLSYRCWTNTHTYYEMDEAVLQEIDAAVAMGQRYNIHVNLSFHRAPGYCVNAPAEPLDLWNDEAALDAFAWQWSHFARRYKGIANCHLSFNLLNEPPFALDETVYMRVARRLVEAIRAEDSERLILADGLAHGNVPVPGLISLQVAQSTRGYVPLPISHYEANWVEPNRRACENLGWPLQLPNGERWDRERLFRESIEPWQQLVQHQGVGVHVGEWGAFNKTPHSIALAWMSDCLWLWKQAGWGWALWNFRGEFGILDSKRSDVQYESWNGHQLDRQMLELLQNN